MRAVKRGSGFRGILNYVFANVSAHFMGGNMIYTNARSLASEFGVSRALRPTVEKPVWHQALRLPAGDKLSKDRWVHICDDYMKNLGFTDAHQRTYVMHDEVDGQHVHIIASRIGLNGTLYLGKNENLQSTRIIAQIEKSHQLRVTKSHEIDELGRVVMPANALPKKSEIEKSLRLGQEPPRQRLQKLVGAAVEGRPSFLQFVERLEGAGVQVLPMSDRNGVKGLSFRLCDDVDQLVFSGSKLGDKYKWPQLSKGIDYDKDRDSSTVERLKSPIGDYQKHSRLAESVAFAEQLTSGFCGRTGEQDPPINNSNAKSDQRNGERSEKAGELNCERTPESLGSTAALKSIDDPVSAVCLPGANTSRNVECSSYEHLITSNYAALVDDTMDTSASQAPIWSDVEGMKTFKRALIRSIKLKERRLEDAGAGAKFLNRVFARIGLDLLGLQALEFDLKCDKQKLAEISSRVEQRQNENSPFLKSFSDQQKNTEISRGTKNQLARVTSVGLETSVCAGTQPRMEIAKCMESRSAPLVSPARVVKAITARKAHLNIRRHQAKRPTQRSKHQY
ncbi:relaxase/mobilization nuclease domain-containing protein [Pusillimonas sp. ANT_WB101]|uniref:relaxase/mobilization nuclease domain-containing protein n=1 Tax=Pusillimonas sp. ANT_WB101 TaxID=2597356 RepID=UPI0021021724|nr:relaxase/mobilization nuclease domain-containing protein [Pusillimonas sp. ANT_WB101]